MSRWAIYIAAGWFSISVAPSRWLNAQAPIAAEVERRVATTTATAPTTEATKLPANVRVTTSTFDPAPTRITFRAKNARADDVFRALCHQAGATYLPEQEGMWSGGVPTLDAVDFRDVPFWEAFADVMGRTGTRPGTNFVFHESPDAVTVAQRFGGGAAAPAAAPPVVVAGPVLLRAVSVERRAAMWYGTPRQAEQVEVTLQLLIEPRMRTHAISGRVTLDRAVDENGLSLVPTRPNQPFSTNRLMGAPTAAVLLERPAGAGRRIAMLRGDVGVYVPRRINTVQVEDPLGGADNLAIPLRGATLTMKRSGLRTHAVDIEFGLERGEGMADEEWYDAVATLSGSLGRMWLIGPEGPLGTSGSSGSSSGGRSASVRISYSISPERPAHRLWIDFPTEFATVPATFEFKDLPMP